MELTKRISLTHFIYMYIFAHKIPPYPTSHLYVYLYIYHPFISTIYVYTYLLTYCGWFLGQADRSVAPILLPKSMHVYGAPPKTKAP